MPNNIQQEVTMADSNIQPYILCVRGQNQTSWFLVEGDFWFLQAHNTEHLVNAFNLLFKTYFALNVCYPPGLQNFYNFIETYVYGWNTTARSVVTSFHVN